MPENTEKHLSDIKRKYGVSLNNFHTPNKAHQPKT